MVIHVTGAQEQMLQQLAAAAGTSSESLAAEFFGEWLREQAELHEELAQARAEYAAGRCLTSDEVWRRLEGLMSSR